MLRRLRQRVTEANWPEGGGDGSDGGGGGVLGGAGCSQDEMRAECRLHLSSSSMRPGGGTLCK